MKDVISAMILGVFLGVIVALLVVSRLAMAEPKYTPPAPADHMGIFGTTTTGGPLTLATQQPLEREKFKILSLNACDSGDLSKACVQHEVASISGEGRVFLNGKEVHTDREYRAVMMALAKGITGCKP